MSNHAIPVFLAAASILFLPACAGERLKDIHSISVNPNTTRPKTIAYSNQASTIVDSFEATAASAGALLPMIVLSGASKKVTTKPKMEIEAAAHSIAIERIVPAAFADELARSGLVTVVPAGRGDASLDYMLLGYGITHPSSSWSESALAPSVGGHARIIGKDGHTLTVFKAIGGVAPRQYWHTHEEFRDRPELMREGWEAAARVAAQRLITVMGKAMGGKKPTLAVGT